jgi:CheY-like chemotaxis protein
MDCLMPEMDGYEATRRIRQLENDPTQTRPWNAPIHITAMTANAMQGDREKCLAAGMDDYISKPARSSDLQATLERWHKTRQSLPEA